MQTTFLQVWCRFAIVSQVSCNNCNAIRMLYAYTRYVRTRIVWFSRIHIKSILRVEHYFKSLV